MVAFNVKTRDLKRKKFTGEDTKKTSLTNELSDEIIEEREKMKRILGRDNSKEKITDNNKTCHNRQMSKTKWKTPNILQSMNFTNTPMLTKLSFISLLLSVIAFTTPNWISLTNKRIETHFGLWHYCGQSCDYVKSKSLITSDLPAWYMYARLCYTVAVLCSFVTLLIIRSHTVFLTNDGQIIKWTSIVKRTCLCILAISALQQLMTIIVFSIQGLQIANHPLSHLTKPVTHHFRLSFYCATTALITTVLQLISLIIY